MATAYHNLSDYDFNSVPDAKEMKFGIVVSEWNFNITGKLLEGAMNTLKKHGARDENILVKTVPGSFELIFGANQFIEYSNVDAVIAIGCVVRKFPHFTGIGRGHVNHERYHMSRVQLQRYVFFHIQQQKTVICFEPNRKKHALEC